MVIGERENGRSNTRMENSDIEMENGTIGKVVIRMEKGTGQLRNQIFTSFIFTSFLQKIDHYKRPWY